MMSRDGANYKACKCHMNHNNCKYIVLFIVDLKKYLESMYLDYYMINKMSSTNTSHSFECKFSRYDSVIHLESVQL